jgi:hypothetical protein
MLFPVSVLAVRVGNLGLAPPEKAARSMPSLQQTRLLANRRQTGDFLQAAMTTSCVF